MLRSPPQCLHLALVIASAHKSFHRHPDIHLASSRPVHVTPQAVLENLDTGKYPLPEPFPYKVRHCGPKHQFMEAAVQSLPGFCHLQPCGVHCAALSLVCWYGATGGALVLYTTRGHLTRAAASVQVEQSRCEFRHTNAQLARLHVRVTACCFHQQRTSVLGSHRSSVQLPRAINLLTLLPMILPVSCTTAVSWTWAALSPCTTSLPYLHR